MEDTIRLIITVLFIGLVVLTIIFFGIFGIAPLTRLNTVLKTPPQSTSSAAFPDVPPPVSSIPSGEPPQVPAGHTTSSSPPETQRGAPSGEAVKNPGPVRFIAQSAPIRGDQVPSGAKRLTVSGANGFAPPVVTVQAGSVFTIALISGDDETHVFKFDDPALASIGLGVGPHETRTITLSIPNPGTYPFHCDVPGHASRGEMGKIVVQ